MTLHWKRADLLSWGETHKAQSGLYRKSWSYTDPSPTNPDGVLFSLTCPDGTELGPFGCESAVDLEIIKRERRMSTFESVWDAIEDTPEQAAALRLRAELMRSISERLTGAGWDRVEAARRCGVTTPRLDELTEGKLDRFPIEELIRIGTNLGLRMRIEMV